MATLFGKREEKKFEEEHLVHKNPKNDYEKFIERYCRRNLKGSGLTEETSVKRGQKEWKKNVSDNNLLSSYLNLLPGEVPLIREVSDSSEENKSSENHQSDKEGFFVKKQKDEPEAKKSSEGINSLPGPSKEKTQEEIGEINPFKAAFDKQRSAKINHTDKVLALQEPAVFSDKHVALVERKTY